MDIPHLVIIPSPSATPSHLAPAEMIQSGEMEGGVERWSLASSLSSGSSSDPRSLFSIKASISISRLKYTPGNSPSITCDEDAPI